MPSRFFLLNVLKFDLYLLKQSIFRALKRDLERAYLMIVGQSSYFTCCCQRFNLCTAIFYRCHSGFEPPADLDPRSKSVSGYGPPFADLDPLPNFPFKHRLYHIWQLILFASFLSMFFSITILKVKNNSHFVPILPHLLQRVVQYTQELDANKLLHSND